MSWGKYADQTSYRFSSEFIKFNNTGARMQDSIYHTTVFICNFRTKCKNFRHELRDVVMDVINNVTQRIQVICIFNPLVRLHF